MLKLLAVFAACSAALFGQAQAVNLVQGPPPQAWVSLFYYNGSNQITYICTAPSAGGPVTTYSVGGSPAVTNIVVSGGTGTITFGATAQLWVGQKITTAGSATTALNGVYPLLTVSGSTATITTSAADATYTDMTISTAQPRLDQLLWSIQIFTYASGNLATSYWGGTPTGVTVPQNLACSNKGNY